jgi:hypothetical protein
MIAGIFPGKVIIVDHGKKYCRANSREKGRAMTDPAYSVTIKRMCNATTEVPAKKGQKSRVSY